MLTKYLVIRKSNCYALSVWNNITKDHFVLDTFDSIHKAVAMQQYYNVFVQTRKGVTK